MNNVLLKHPKSLLLLAGLASATGLQASTDYAPAVWYPSSCVKYYTSGYGKQFFVIHVMEGYYQTLVSWQGDCSITTSVAYAYNSLKQSSGDPYAAGEIGQFVRDDYYAYTHRCWNKYAMGCEHEGFVSNPAWFTDTLYRDSAALGKSKAEKYGFAKDRNHFVGHNEKSNAAWCTWSAANFTPAGTFDPTCNTHGDPGAYWNWSSYMTYINQGGNASTFASITAPSSVNAGAAFQATVQFNNTGSSFWCEATSTRIGSQNPQDNTRWGMNRVATSGTIAPGTTGTWVVNATAPTTGGTYAFDWKMVQDGVEWFGATGTKSIVVNAASLVDVIVDNNSAGFSASANWVTATSATEKYGADYRYRSTAAVSDMATWTANLANAGTYKVYAWWSSGANRAANIGYRVNYSGTYQDVYVNQQATGGQWVLLGTYAMAAGNNTVNLSCWTTTGFVAVADAVRWQQQ